jgi:LysM repeat protein
MSLAGKYKYGIDTAQKLGVALSVEEKNNKLYLHGQGPQDAVYKVWDALKTIPEWKNDLVADIKELAPTASSQHADTYTVQSGDTLSKIAKHHLGDANAYMEIFNLNRDQLSDPDKIRPGQVLKLPVNARTH